MSQQDLEAEISNLRFSEVQPLKAPKWADSGHTQTIFGHIIPSPMVQGPLQELTVPLSDGEKLKAYYGEGTSDWIVSIFPGLGGEINADYMQRTSILCKSLGYGFVMVNHRGVYEGITLAKNSYHSGSAQDVSDVINFMKVLKPGHKHIAIGVSVSGTIVLNLMTGRMGTTKPEAAITINGPLDLLDGSRKLSSGLNRLYDFRFVRRLNREIERKYKLGMLPQKFEIPLLATVFDFDAIYTGPMSGFGTRENYYETCSPKNHLHHIDRPVIMLHAADDPFVDVKHYLEVHRKGLSPHIELHIEARGGHLGYYAGESTELGTNRWLDYFLLKAFLRLEKKLGIQR